MNQIAFPMITAKMQTNFYRNPMSDLSPIIFIRLTMSIRTRDLLGQRSNPLPTHLKN